jgi:endonuclease-8
VPEGDTIAKAAARLRPALAGFTLVRFEANRLRGERPKPGTRIDDVESRGKHLLVHFADGLTLRTHMRMTGSWHLYRAGERWRKAPHLLRALIEADSGWTAVCFAAPVVETYRRNVEEPAALASLGPDLCLPGVVDEDVLAAILDRIDRIAEPSTSVGEILLDQRIASGVGNVYKSEVCFACGVDPFAPVYAVDDDLRRRLYATAARQLQANLSRAARTTWRSGLAVYGRRGQPCSRCGTPVRMARQGELARATYWCPSCQPSRKLM